MLRFFLGAGGDDHGDGGEDHDRGCAVRGSVISRCSRGTWRGNRQLVGSEIAAA